MKYARIAATSLFLAIVSPALAQGTMKMEGHDMPGHGAKPGKAAAMADGEVRKVDKDAKKITIKHGPIANLDMPPMTMVFQVKDPAMIDKVKAGDRIKFSADKVGGAFTVTRIEPAN